MQGDVAAMVEIATGDGRVRGERLRLESLAGKGVTVFALAEGDRW